MPIPRSKSPIKTFLQSSPRRHPSLGPKSSPIRGSIVTPSRVNVPPSVNRRLNFAIDDVGRSATKEVVRESPQKQKVPQKRSPTLFKSKLSNGTRFSPLTREAVASYQENKQENYEPIQDDGDHDLDLDLGGDSYQPMIDDEEEAEIQHSVGKSMPQRRSPEPEPQPPRQVSRKRPRSPPVAEMIPKPTKAKSPSQNHAASAYVEEDVRERPAKKARGRPKKVESSKAVIPKKHRPKTGVRRDSSPLGISSPPEVLRAPPRPKNNRGLYILRRETPDDVGQTRSGRNVIKPVAYWKNETVVYGDDEDADGDASFLRPTIKEVIRVERSAEEGRESSRRGKKAAGAGKAKKRKEPESEEEEEDFEEPWELEPGRIYGGIRLWNPEDPTGRESDEIEDEIALSSAAIITRDIPKATFKFAKTLTLPFFGSGMLDLPPGGMKRPKNSQKMQMVFFVFSGRVNVTVNDNAFRIGKGGIWQVPRGNMLRYVLTFLRSC
jgi:centromere protein C